jgi:hypothetical protein
VLVVLSDSARAYWVDACFAVEVEVCYEGLRVLCFLVGVGDFRHYLVGDSALRLTGDLRRREGFGPGVEANGGIGSGRPT